jgi:acetyltransferase-like isoleucine patch superfamily enzyme
MVDPDVVLGENVKIYNKNLVNIFGCEIGDETFVGPFVEITRGVKIGKKCIIESHSFICTGVIIDDDVFIGHGVTFVNDLYARTHRHVEYVRSHVKRGASIGSNAVIIGATVGQCAVIGAGAVITKNVEDYSIYAGNPAKKIKQFKNYDEMLEYMTAKQKTVPRKLDR